MGMSNAALRAGFPFLVAVALAGCGGGGGTGSTTALTEQAQACDATQADCGDGDREVALHHARPKTCDQMVGLTVPAAAIGLPTRGAAVTSAAVVPAAGTGASALPEYCLVNGKISPIDTTAPDILFRVALPTDWNSKIVMFGGGGFDGSIPNVAGNVPVGPTDQLLPLGRGYATFASDSGHQADALGSQDGTFLMNDEAMRNWGGEALKKTRDASVYLDQGALCAVDPQGLLRRRLHRRARGDPVDHALAEGLGRRDRRLPGLEPGLGDARRPPRQSRAGTSRAPTRACPSARCCSRRRCRPATPSTAWSTG